MSNKKPTNSSTNPPPKPSQPVQTVNLGDTPAGNPPPKPSQPVQTVTKTTKPK